MWCILNAKIVDVSDMHKIKIAQIGTSKPVQFAIKRKMD